MKKNKIAGARKMLIGVWAALTLHLVTAEVFFSTHPRGFTVGIGDTGVLVCEIQVTDEANYGE